MRESHEKPTTINGLESEFSVPGRSDRETWSIRGLLLLLVLGILISVLVPGISPRWRVQVGFGPQALIGFAILTLVFYLHLASQRRLLRTVSTALLAATAYVDRLEQVSLIDANTQLFNRKYLDQLFNQQLKWLNRCGKSATLVLFEVLPHAQKPTGETVFIEAALVLRSSFRGSDYVLRNSGDQFLVLLPDTTEEEAQYALNRLTDKVDRWNLENEMFEMALRQELSTCPPGGDLWETLSKIEERMKIKPETRSGLRDFAEPCKPLCTK